MIKILNCYFYAKKSYGTLSKGAIFFGHPCIYLVNPACHYRFVTYESWTSNLF